MPQSNRLFSPISALLTHRINIDFHTISWHFNGLSLLSAQQIKLISGTNSEVRNSAALQRTTALQLQSEFYEAYDPHIAHSYKMHLAAFTWLLLKSYM